MGVKGKKIRGKELNLEISNLMKNKAMITRTIDMVCREGYYRNDGELNQGK